MGGALPITSIPGSKAGNLHKRLPISGFWQMVGHFYGVKEEGKENAHCLYYRSGLYYTLAYPATNRQGASFCFAAGPSRFGKPSKASFPAQ
jgi:hypothetical protein